MRIEFMSSKRHWENHCNHGDGCFIGSGNYILVHYKHEEPLKRWIDVDVYEDSIGTSVCIRYGNEPSEYISAGLLADFMFSVNKNEDYGQAWSIMRENGKLSYHKNS